MSNSLSFKDLVNLTFNDGSVHLKHLQILLKILVNQLELDEVTVSVNSNILTATELDSLAIFAADHSFSTDPVIKAVPASEKILQNVCDSKSNPIADMFNILNITKRLEAVELSIQKMTSLFDTIFEKETLMEEMIKNCRSPVAKTSREEEVSDDELQELMDANTPRPSLQTLSNLTVHSYLDECSSSTSTSKTEEAIEQINIEETVKVLVNSEIQNLNDKLDKLKEDFCEIQKEMCGFKEDIADVMFANEQIDGFFNETMNEMKSFNAKIFCLNTDVKTLLQDVEESKKKFAEMDSKYEAMNINKTNNSYVDELLSQKAYKSDLYKFVTIDEFDSVCDVLRLKVALLDENLPKIQARMKAHLACFKTEIDEKLDKCELKKFKDHASDSFQVFLSDLKSLLMEMSKKPFGTGGFQVLETGMSCVCCKSQVQMEKSTKSVPRLDSAATTFKRRLDQSALEKCKSNAALRNVLKLAKTPETNDMAKVCCEEKKMNLTNFPNSQPHFEVGADQVITKIDALRGLQTKNFL